MNPGPLVEEALAGAEESPRWPYSRWSTASHSGIRAALCDQTAVLLGLGLVLLAIATMQRPAPESASILRFSIPWIVVFDVLFVGYCQAVGLYRDRRGISPARDIFRAFTGLLAANILTIFIAVLTNSSPLKSGQLVAILLGLLILCLSLRAVATIVTYHRLRQGKELRNAIIVGANRAGRKLSELIRSNQRLGYSFCGFVDEDADSPEDVVGGVRDLPRLGRQCFLDEIFVTTSDQRIIAKVLEFARGHHIDVTIIPIFCFEERLLRFNYMGEVPAFVMRQREVSSAMLPLKRVLDIILGGIAVAVTLPLWIAIAAWIKTDSQGPVLYRSIRIGKKGRKFVFYKFRSMVAEADNLKRSLQEKNERTGLLFKISDDPRVTRVGRFIRKYSLDELPQLINVLKGDMSLVGPRPPSLDEYERYDWQHLCKLTVRPGITGLWQVSARRDPSFECALHLDTEYICNWSPWMDISILLRTIPAVLQGNGS